MSRLSVLKSNATISRVDRQANSRKNLLFQVGDPRDSLIPLVRIAAALMHKHLVQMNQRKIFIFYDSITE
jgi:hypothetical protein